MARVTQHLRRRKNIVAWIIFALAVVTRLSMHAYYFKEPLGAPLGGEVVAMARTYAREGALADAFGPGTGPTAHSTPLYPMLLGAILNAVGDDSAGYATIRVITCFSAATSYALLPTISTILGFSWTAGALGGLAGALLPYYAYETSGEFENVLATTLFLAIVLCMNLNFFYQTWPFVSPLLFGMLSGIMALFGASFLPATVTAALEAVKRRSGSISLRFVLVAVCGLMAILSPWIIRNYFVFHSFIPLRGNFWLEVAISNQDGSDAAFERNFSQKTHHKLHPSVNRKERARYLEIGERAYMAEKRQQAMRWIMSNKVAFLKLALQRFWNIWFFDFNNVFLNLACWGIVLGGFAGIWIGAKRLVTRRGCFYLLKLLCAFAFIHLFVQVSARYRYPIHVLMLVPFGFFCAHLVDSLIGMSLSRAKIRYLRNLLSVFRDVGTP